MYVVSILSEIKNSRGIGVDISQKQLNSFENSFKNKLDHKSNFTVDRLTK